MLTVFAIPAWLCYVILYPISRLATLLSKGLLRLVGIRMTKENEEREFTKVDLDYLVQTSIDNAEDEDQIGEEVKIFQNALDFSETKVRDCMVPRTEIDAVEDTATIEHSSDMFTIGTKDAEPGNHNSQFSILNSQFIREISFIPETMLASRLMKQLMQQKRSLAIVVDEFGGTSGLVSLEDIVEEITGEIEDEHDSTNHVAKQLSDHEYILSARLEISKINEQFDLELPESDEYMTLGGLILHVYQSFPKLNEVVKFDNYEFKIVKNTATKIELVRLTVLK